MIKHKGDKILVNKTSLIKILIAEDSTLTGLLMNNYFNKQKTMRVIGTVRNDLELFSLIAIETPDIIILDADKFENGGLNMLEQLNRKYSNNINVLILCGFWDADYERRTITLGAKGCFIKPVDFEFLHNQILDISYKKISKKDLMLVKDTPGEMLDDKIKSLFFMMGIPIHLKGYRYLNAAIKMVVNSPNIINNITKVLYPGIAENFQTSPTRVERAIRNAIEVAWIRGNLNKINDIFGYEILNQIKPTNGQFIALLAAKINMEKDII